MYTPLSATLYPNTTSTFGYKSKLNHSPFPTKAYHHSTTSRSQKERKEMDKTRLITVLVLLLKSTLTAGKYFWWIAFVLAHPHCLAIRSFSAKLLYLTLAVKFSSFRNQKHRSPDTGGISCLWPCSNTTSNSSKSVKPQRNRVQLRSWKRVHQHNCDQQSVCVCQRKTRR